jgi:heptosyltransferase-2
VQTSFLGDVVLTTPLLARLARDGPVDVVTTPGGARILAGHPAIARLITYDKHGTDRGARGFLRVARECHGATRAFLCQGSTRSGALAFAAGCGTRIGFDTSAGRWTYTQRVTYRADWHHARRLLSLADWPLAESAADFSDDAIRPSLFPSDAEVRAVDALLARRERPMIALAPGSVWATKRWPGYAELATLLAPDFDLAIVGSGDDSAAAAEIRERVDGGRVIDATGKLSLLGSAELLRRADALVTNDSSPQHLASAMGTPTVAIFGPTVPAFGFGPLAPGSRTMGRDALACRPCDRHGPQRCPLGHWRCMHEIVPHEVNEMVRAVIATERAR